MRLIAMGMMITGVPAIVPRLIIVVIPIILMLIVITVDVF
jgi:hypothetical protein